MTRDDITRSIEAAAEREQERHRKAMQSISFGYTALLVLGVVVIVGGMILALATCR